MLATIDLLLHRDDEHAAPWLQALSQRRRQQFVGFEKSAQMERVDVLTVTCGGVRHDCLNGASATARSNLRYDVTASGACWV